MWAVVLLVFGMLAGSLSTAAAQEKGTEKKKKAKQETVYSPQIAAMLNDRAFICPLQSMNDYLPLEEPNVLRVYPHRFKASYYDIDTDDYGYQVEQNKRGWKVTITAKDGSQWREYYFVINVPAEGGICTVSAATTVSRSILYQGVLRPLPKEE